MCPPIAWRAATEGAFCWSYWSILTQKLRINISHLYPPFSLPPKATQFQEFYIFLKLLPEGDRKCTKRQSDNTIWPSVSTDNQLLLFGCLSVCFLSFQFFTKKATGHLCEVHQQPVNFFSGCCSASFHGQGGFLYILLPANSSVDMWQLFGQKYKKIQ